MIYEMRTYDLVPRTVPEVEKRFGEAYEHRKKYSELAGAWHTEIGLLHQLVHVWPYKDLAERDRVRAAAAKDKHWPPDIDEFILRQESTIFLPLPFSPEPKSGSMGPFFEMRTYRYYAGELPVIIKTWEDAIDVPLRFMPLWGVWHSELGALNQLVHVWPYRSLDERMLLRSKAHDTGLWPPWRTAVKKGGRDYKLHSQENKILLPAAFSPVQ